jgi:PHD/YefM family antitoxin component YafN of YafNO toxin-antitoxin module
VDSEGVTANEVEDFIMDAITVLERRARPPGNARKFSVAAAEDAAE